MNLKTFHSSEKTVEAKSLFKATKGQVTSIQLMKDAVLTKHTTPVPAMLICVQGKVHFENEKERQVDLAAGAFTHIEPDVVHWVKGIEDAQLILIR